ncbi:leucyl aminopeptidase [Sphingosinicella sp. CPCC 101087]|uniref:leucyl aminopeptidase n=1 Tax=Sphingosinicella sp. CPCC 101087 TaxID=2497754 RepID=UPI00101CC9C2|nr:leucyl aminopeptidase [Sphingosinicella sp. CPCC 101087]
MKVSFAAKRPKGAYALAVPVRSDDMLHDRLAGLDDSARTLAARSAEAQRFEREIGAIAETFIEEGDIARRLLLVGYGGRQESAATHERVGGALTAKLLTSGETKLVIDAAGLDARSAARLAFGAAARSWRHDVYRTRLGRKQRPTLEEVIIVGADKGVEAEWKREAAVLKGLDLTRQLVSDPPNIIYPETFVDKVREAMDGLGVEIQVLDEKAMRKLGMGALLGVAQGSARPPRLLAMRWKGAPSSKRNVAFIGKGITFDTGGISIKPAQGMEAMKWDMGGAGAVAGAILALAARKAKANVVGVCVLAENMPDGNAQRPGDIVTSMSGQTIEVINTDAEGRLVLADAMTWTQREHKPEVMIDLATLTGAMIVSLGHEYGGLFANDDGLAERLAEAGRESGDKLWRMPMGDAYDKIMDSPIADMKNAGAREAGSITAACFLGRFVEEGVKWAHLDIAGMVWADKPSHLYDKGATGYGVALLDRYVADNHEG